MKGFLLNTTTLGGKKYTYNDISQGIVASQFPVDKFYGGRVRRFGKTKEGLLLCLEHNREEVIDIFIDVGSIDKLPRRILIGIAGNLKEKKLLSAAPEKRMELEESLKIDAKMSIEELIKFIGDNMPQLLDDKK
jgi:hypothetical protein